MGWVLGHLPDLVSDFSVLHRVDDVGLVPAVTFFMLAARLPAYQGVMRAVVAAEASEDEEGPQAPPPVPQQPGVSMVGGSRAELQSEPSFAGIFSFNKPGG